jgi:hypothetical protein
LPLSPTIAIAVLDVGAGVGEGDGVVGGAGELPPPHAASPANDAKAPIRTNLERRMSISLGVRAPRHQHACQREVA